LYIVITTFTIVYSVHKCSDKTLNKSTDLCSTLKYTDLQIITILVATLCSD